MSIQYCCTSVYKALDEANKVLAKHGLPTFTYCHSGGGGGGVVSHVVNGFEPKQVFVVNGSENKINEHY